MRQANHDDRIRWMWTALLSVAVLSIMGVAPAIADQWPRFRGPNGTGVSDLKGLPTAWAESDYEWVVQLPGLGHSSPVIWDEALFLTTASDDGARTLHRYNALTGKDEWNQMT